jgi:sialidase-1
MADAGIAISNKPQKETYTMKTITALINALFVMVASLPLQGMTPTSPMEGFRMTDVFVSGEGDYNTYRIPVLVESKAGTLLAFCEGRRDSARDTGNIDMLLRRSLDGGRTWGPIQFLHGEEGRVAMHNPVGMVERKSGDIHLVFVREAKEVFHMRSTDDGVTFSEPVNITSVIREMYDRIDYKWSMVHTGPVQGLQTRDGRLVVPLKTMVSRSVAMDQFNGVGRIAGVIFSDDNGRTWQAGGTVPSEIGDLSEGTVVERRDGMLILNIRWHDGGFRAVSMSPDGGLTWSPARADPALPDQGCQGSMLSCSLVRNDMRFLFSNLPGAFRGFSKRDGLTVRLSYDEGQTWAGQWEVAPGYFTGYSDLTVTSEGKVLILFEMGEKIYSDKIALAWLDGIIE